MKRFLVFSAVMLGISGVARAEIVVDARNPEVGSGGVWTVTGGQPIVIPILISHTVPEDPRLAGADVYLRISGPGVDPVFTVLDIVGVGTLFNGGTANPTDGINYSDIYGGAMLSAGDVEATGTLVRVTLSTTSAMIGNTYTLTYSSDPPDPGIVGDTTLWDASFDPVSGATFHSAQLSVVPEPAAIAQLIGLAVVGGGLVGWRWRRRARAATTERSKSP